MSFREKGREVSERKRGREVKVIEKEGERVESEG